LIVLMVSPPALASPNHLGLGSLRLQQIGREIRGVERMPDIAKDLAAGLVHDVDRVFSKSCPKA